MMAPSLVLPLTPGLTEPITACPAAPVTAPFARTLIDLVREQAERAPQALALVCAEGRFSYSDLAARAALVAGAASALGCCWATASNGPRIDMTTIFEGLSMPLPQRREARTIDQAAQAAQRRRRHARRAYFERKGQQ